MSYSYLFLRFPERTEIGRVISISELALPLGPIAQIQAALALLHPDIQWSEFKGAVYGTVGPHCKAEFTLDSVTGSNAISFHGPKEWIAPICAAMQLHCWDPQINEIWCPDGKRVFVEKA